MLSNTFHGFVLFMTILFYFLLRKQNRKINNKYSKFYLTLYIPIILYSCYYLFFYNDMTNLNGTGVKSKLLHDSIISDIYPSSVTI